MTDNWPINELEWTFVPMFFSKSLSQKNSKSFLCPWGLKFFLVEEFYVENHPSVKIHTYEFSPDEYYSCRQVHRFPVHRSRVKNRHVTTVVHRRRPRKGESDFHCQFLGVWVWVKLIFFTVKFWQWKSYSPKLQNLFQIKMACRSLRKHQLINLRNSQHKNHHNRTDIAHRVYYMTINYAAIDFLT